MTHQANKTTRKPDYICPLGKRILSELDRLNMTIFDVEEVVGLKATTLYNIIDDRGRFDNNSAALFGKVTGHWSSYWMKIQGAPCRPSSES